MFMSIPINTIGDLKRLIADLPDDTRVCLSRETRDGIDYLWRLEASVDTLCNNDEGCGVCDDALRSPRSKGVANCPDHSGKQLVIRL
jgi:hypothetical protein